MLFLFFVSASETEIKRERRGDKFHLLSSYANSPLYCFGLECVWDFGSRFFRGMGVKISYNLKCDTQRLKKKKWYKSADSNVLSSLSGHFY